MSDNVIPFRTADGLTEAEVNETIAALYRELGAGAEVTTHTGSHGERSVAVTERDMTRGVCREDRRFVLFDSNGELLADARRLEDLLAIVSRR